MDADVMPLPRDDSLPSTLRGFLERFSTEADCEQFLRTWKYGPDGFLCPRCGGSTAWFVPSRRLDECTSCHKQVSLTAGTVMHGTRKPLRDWFLAMYLFVVSKQGISALSLSRQLGLSYPAAWTWLHKLRAAVNTRPKSKLEGVVEADETWEGGLRKGELVRPTVGEKALVAGAIEVQEHAWGRARLASVSDGSSLSLGTFLQENITEGSALRTDDWRSYRRPAKALRLNHVATNISKSDQEAHEIHPAVHRLFSLLHRVLLTTYQGAVSQKHLPNYLAEFEFRFSRRNSNSRTLLFQRLLSCTVRRAPPYYWEILDRPDGETPLWEAA